MRVPISSSDVIHGGLFGLLLSDAVAYASDSMDEWAVSMLRTVFNGMFCRRLDDVLFEIQRQLPDERENFKDPLVLRLLVLRDNCRVNGRPRLYKGVFIVPFALL